MISLSLGVGLQYASRGIRCNVVLPGYMHSERMVARFKSEMGEAWEEEIERRKRAVPAGRLGEPWDVAHAVTFLVSDEARYINGVTLPVDGGISMAATPQFVT